MSKYATAALFAMLALSACSSKDGFEVGGLRIGMSPSQIANPPASDPELSQIRGHLSRETAQLGNDGKLHIVIFSFDPMHYNKIAEAYKSKYLKAEFHCGSKPVESDKPIASNSCVAVANDESIGIFESVPGMKRGGIYLQGVK